jgi:hypothetical protein
MRISAPAPTVRGTGQVLEASSQITPGALRSGAEQAVYPVFHPVRYSSDAGEDGDAYANRQQEVTGPSEVRM